MTGRYRDDITLGWCEDDWSEFIDFEKKQIELIDKLQKDINSINKKLDKLTKK